MHYSRLLRESDIHPLRLPPRTRMARSVIDAAAWMATDRGAQAQRQDPAGRRRWLDAVPLRYVAAKIRDGLWPPGQRWQPMQACRDPRLTTSR
ncbi:MAG: hypothetical protein M3Z75_17700 [Actinomycetota bacterium]|nr:hypothetical protein [Actinomycetota bacterium]